MFTSSISFPNMIDVTHNKISVSEDNDSVINRTRLLILTSPTELYNEPNFGVGLKQYLWQYNTENVRAVIQDKIISQLRLHEPCVDADGTTFANDSLFSAPDKYSLPNELNMTVGLQTIYSDQLKMELNTDTNANALT